MKISCLLAVSAAFVGANEVDKIENSAAAPKPRAGHSMSADGPHCNIMPLSADMLVAKYGMNMSDPDHLIALSDAVNGNLQLGSITQLLPESSDASRVGALVIDGLSGAVDFPHGNLKVLATVGEISQCEDSLGEAFTGVPDGMGAYLVDDETIRIVVQSESYGPLLYETYPYYVNNGAASFTGSHVHYLDYDRMAMSQFMRHGGPASEMIKGFGQVATKYYNLAGEPVGPRMEGATTVGAHYSNTDVNGVFALEEPPSEADWLMQSLCSAHLEEKHQWGSGIGFEDNIYITNEEWITYEDGKEFVGISMHAMDLDNKEDWAVGAVTQTGFEKIAEINPQHTDYVMLAVSGYNGAYSGNTAELDARNAEYGNRPDGKPYVWTRDIVPARIYVGIKGKMEDGSDAPEDDFLARNGLRYGKLYGHVVDMSEGSQTEGLWRDAFHKPRANGAQIEGKFVALDWQWDGVVKNYRHDGGWEFQNDVPGYEGTDWKWWTAKGPDESGSKTEHLSPDTRPGITGFIQTSTAGYFGHYYIHDVEEILNMADGLPSEFEATYHVYQGEQDITAQIVLDGEGLTAINEECPGVTDATQNCDNPGSVKTSFEDIDGFEVVSAAEGLYAIIQEDSGNELGERMFTVKLDHSGEELDYFFIAQSGGKFNTRMGNGVGIPAGANAVGNSHEFSGVIDISGMTSMCGGMMMSRRGGRGKKGGDDDDDDDSSATRGFCAKAGTGFSKRMAENAVSMNDKLIVLNLQAHNMFGGPVEAFKTDRGGQLFLWQPYV